MLPEIELAEMKGRMAMIDRNKCDRAAVAIGAILDALECNDCERVAAIARVMVALAGESTHSR